MVLESRTQTGQLGEDLAVAHMEDLGHHVLERNWRWRRFEIDVISAQGRQLVFHEVKSRTGCDVAPYRPDLPSMGQRRRIVQAAQAYLLREGRRGRECRFDVWWVTFRDGRSPHVTHLTNAFDGVSKPPRKRNPWRALR